MKLEEKFPNVTESAQKRKEKITSIFWSTILIASVSSFLLIAFQ